MEGAAGRLAALALASTLAAGCAAKLPPRPAGPSSPSTDVVARHGTLTRHCAGLQTMTAELGLSGRAGEQRLRGRVIAGLQRGGAVRLEGVAPFGAPVFILAAKDERATLLLPRERRVLESAPVAQVIERLTGLALGADDLLLTLAGCVAAGTAVDGREWPGGWESVSSADGRTVLLRRRDDAWWLAAVDGPGWRADYSAVLNGFPRQVRLRSEDGRVDLTAAVQQLEVNTPIAAAAFEVTIPQDAEPMTLEQLRAVAPLRTP
jgi:hypothetical protein